MSILASFMKVVRLHDKDFGLFISSEKIQNRIEELGGELNNDLKNKNPLFLIVLNGAFLFAADLIKKFQSNCEISFVKLSSYAGTNTTGTVKKMIGVSENIEGRTVVVIEDIIDTGNTLDYIINDLNFKNPAKIKIAALLFKPKAYQKNTKIDYVGFEVENDFLVGYGLDYDGLGRNLNDIYKLN